MLSHVPNPRAEAGEARVGRLALHVAVVDLLNDDGDFEDGEDLVITDVREIAAGPRGIAIDDLVAREVARSMRHRRQRVALLRRCRRLPVRQDYPEIDER